MTVRVESAITSRGAALSVSSVLWILLGLGAIVRLALEFETTGAIYDLNSYALVNKALISHPLHVYAAVNQPVFRWPYPPGFFPFIRLAGAAAHHLSISFTKVIRIWPVLADLVIAWLVYDFLRWRGVTERTRLAGAAAVALGPLFVANSGYHGQIDSVAMLPAVAAIAWWDRLPSRWRALVAGALIGIGGSLKSVPLLMIIPLLAQRRSLREAAELIAGAAAIMLISIAPFLVADPHGVLHITAYHSLFGLGGLSLLVQPNLADAWLANQHIRYNGLTNALQGHLGTAVVVVAVGLAIVLVLRMRPAPVDGAVLLWLAVFAFSINWGPRYAIWGLPFFIMAGHIVKSLVLQVALLIPSVLIYALPVSASWANYVYVPILLGALAVFMVSAVLMARRLIRGNEQRQIGGLAPV